MVKLKFLLAGLIGACGAIPIHAEQVQRQELSGAQGTVSGSGQKLEISAGQSLDATFTGGGILYAGYLNTDHAPGTVTDLSAVTGASEATAQVAWTEIGADGAIGQATALIVKVATAPITTQALFEAASTYAVLTPLAPGGFESQVLMRLLPGPDYYFAVEARDAAKNQGALSNLVSTQTFALPPADITSLSAVTAGGGAAQLSWLSPGDDGNVGDLNPGQYRVAYSTAVAPVFAFDQYQVLIATLAAPGSAQSAVVSGLLGNASYSFSVFTGDDLPVFSGPSNTAQVLTPAHLPSAAAYSGISSTTFTAEWGLNNNTAATEFFVQVAGDPAYSVHLATRDWAPGSSEVFSGLSSETTFYARVKARNAAGVETGFTDLGPVFLPIGIKAPVGISVASADRTLVLHWNPVFSGDPTGTRIYRSTSADGPFVQVAALPLATVSYTDTGLENGVTYYYRLSAFKSTAESALSAAFPGVPQDALSPQGVAGVMGALEAAAFTLSWSPNPYNADGSAMTDLRGYRVYRSSALDAAATEIGFVPPQGPYIYSDPQGAALAPQFYFVRAIDTSDNLSIDSLWLRSPGSGAPLSAFSVAPDRAAMSEIPVAGVSGLSADGVVLLWTRRPSEENGRVALSYSVDLRRSAGGRMEQTYALPLHTRFTFRYVVPGGAGPLAANAVFHPEDLSVFIHNGVEFVKIGGQVEPLNRTITVESRVSGRYLVKQSLRAEQFTVLQTAPRRIFTPNGDGVNDSFQIFFENPKDSVISQAKVYDITGAEVSDLQLGPTGESLSWNGKDHSGRVTRGGIYIYQIQAEGRTYNGTLVLAK